MTMVHAGPPEQDAVQELWFAYKRNGNAELREQLILHYAPLVNKVVGRMGLNPEGAIEWNDLINYGVMGLIDAVERYEPARGVTFQTFASLRIRGSVLDALRQFDPLGRQARRRVREAKEAIQQLTGSLGRTPEDEEVATAIGLTLEQYQQVLQDASFVMLSLDQPLREGGDDQKLRLADLLEDPDAQSTLEQIEEAELHERLVQAIGSLSRREQVLLSLYYYEDLTMREVATVMEISQTRVCQLHARAILTLKALIAPAPAEKQAVPAHDPAADAVAATTAPDRASALPALDRRRSSYKARKYWSQMFGEA